MTTTKLASIQYRYGRFVAIDEGTMETIKTADTYCNPAAIDQLVCELEIDGYQIDWTESAVSNPQDDNDE